jgi:GNAT superfamily N-acetyltransferase
VKPAPEVRPAGREDFPEIERVAAANGESTLAPSWTEWLYLATLLDNGTLLVATQGDRVVGFAAGWRIPGDRPASYITDLFVEPATQSRGIGGALLHELMRTAPSGTWMTCASSDLRAQALYVRAGLRAWWPVYYVVGDRGALERLPVVFSPPAQFAASAIDAADAAALELQLSGRDHAATYRHWLARAGGAAVRLDAGGRPVAVGAARDEKRGAGRVLDHLAVAAGVDPVAAVIAILRSDPVLRSTTRSVAASIRLAVPGPSRVLPVLLEAGFQLTDGDQFCATAPDLVDPERTILDPSIG